MAAASRWSPAAIASRIVSTSRSCGRAVGVAEPLDAQLADAGGPFAAGLVAHAVPAGERIDYHCQVVPLGQQGEDLVRRSHFPCARAGALQDVSFPGLPSRTMTRPSRRQRTSSSCRMNKEDSPSATVIANCTSSQQAFGMG